MKKKIDLSIIILNYNTSDLLRDCLKSIQLTDCDGLSIETIVVDNASSDESQAMVESEFDWVILLKNQYNVGFAAGNNLGITKAKGRYLLFLNSDTLIPEKIFPELINYLDRENKVGGLTVKLVLKNNLMDPDCHRGFPTPWASLTYFLGLEKLWPKSKLFGQYHKFYLSLDQIHDVDSVCGAFLLVRRRAFDEVGGWDENYFFYGEDIDFCFRLKQCGWKIRYYPLLKVIHYKGASSGLRSETRSVARIDKETRIKVAKASIEAMKIFYDKFYKDQYSFLITSIVIFGIQIKGWFRVFSNHLK